MPDRERTGFYVRYCEPHVRMMGEGGRPVLEDGHSWMVAGSADEYCPVEALHRLAGLTAADERVIEGANHFFFGKLYPLGEAIGAWLTEKAPAG